MTTDKEIKVKLKIKSHEPILAASFTEEYDDTNETKVPILGYIPLIGKLFTKTVTQKQKINFFIYILPEAITKNNQDNLFQSIYNHF